MGEVTFQSGDRCTHECYWFLSHQPHLDGPLRATINEEQITFHGSTFCSPAPHSYTASQHCAFSAGVQATSKNGCVVLECAFEHAKIPEFQLQIYEDASKMFGQTC